MKSLGIIFLWVFMNVTGAFCQTHNNICICDSFDKAFFEPLLTGEMLQPVVHISGSQYFYDWDDADIKLYSGELIYNKKIRYNGYLNEMIWYMTEKNIYVKLDKSRISEVYFKNLHALFRNLHISGDYNFQKYAVDTTIFAEVLLESRISMYAYRKIKQVSSDVRYGTSQAFMERNIENAFIYYIKVPDNNSLIAINTINKRNLIRLFPTRKTEIMKILKDNNLTVNSEANFAKALYLIGKVL